MSRRTAIATLFLVLGTTSLQATEFWVSPNGNDRGRGSKNSPWASLQFAANQVRPGDVVHILDGDYTGFYTEKGGTPGARITFVAEGDHVRVTKKNNKTLDGINLEGAKYITLDGFIVNEMPRAGIRATHADGVRVRRVRASQNGRWGIFTSHSNDVVIEYNITSLSRKEHGIYVSNSGDRPIIRGNVSFGNKACGIHMNGDKTQDGDGIISEAIVDSNTVYGNGVIGGSAINADGVQNSKFVNNLLYDNHQRGISLFKEDGGGSSKNNLIAHNTIVMPAKARWAINIKNGATGTQVFNNVILHEKGARGDILVDTESRQGLTCDSNLYTGVFSLDDGDSALTLAKWKTATGGDTNSALTTVAEMKFVDPSTGDFRLNEGSPAIDKADTRYSPRLDRDVKLRDRGSRPDLGAYEFGTQVEPKKSAGTSP